MNCLHPLSFPNPSYGKNGDLRPYITVPCGRCHYCKKIKRNQWAFRLEQECKVCHTSFFITLTYDDEHLPYNSDGDPELRYRDFQLFMKRLRQYYPDSNLRYLCVGEYGKKFRRPHYHAIIFNIPENLKEWYPEKKIALMHFNNHLSEIWKNGFAYAGDVNHKSIRYTTKYCLKGDCTMACSKRPFLGYSYLDSFRIKKMCEDVNALRMIPQHGEKDGKPITWFLKTPDIYLRKMFKHNNLTDEEILNYRYSRARILNNDDRIRTKSPYNGDEKWFSDFKERYLRGHTLRELGIPICEFKKAIRHARIEYETERHLQLCDGERRYLRAEREKEAQNRARLLEDIGLLATYFL